MYFANCTRPDITFLSHISKIQFMICTKTLEWNGIKYILRYLQEIFDLGLFYSYEQNSQLVTFVDASNLSNPHKSRSQIGYVFT